MQPAEPLVFLSPGERVGLHDARGRLNELLEATRGSQGSWQDVMNYATLMLESLPGEPLALAALAEVDYHHGFLQSAISFMSHALNAAPHIASFYHRLADWCREAGNEQGADTIIRLMQQREVQANTLA